ncbi:MAG: FAD-dependent oxidoreductase [Balneolaceae bacterium]
MKRQFSFWEREEWLKAIDLVIVGAGIVGSSAALFYKEKYPDHEVLIVDKGLLPEGASTRNAGFACIGSITEHLSDMEAAGKETVLGRIERRWRGLNLLKERMGELEIGYEHTGGTEVFTNPQNFEEAESHIGEMNKHLKDRIGEKDVYSAGHFQGYRVIFNRLEGAINSGKLIKNLHRRCAEKGVQFWWNMNVQSVSSNSVKLSDELELTPGRILLATNGFTSRLRDVAVKPARGYVFVTEAIPGLQWKGTFHYNSGYVYFRNIGDRLLMGGARDVAKESENTDQFGTNPEIKKWLIDFTNNVVKLPSGWKIDTEWSGIMGFTEDKEPVIQQLEPGVWVAAGLSGMGIAVGTEVAREIVSKI